jgi:hypothetical protein
MALLAEIDPTAVTIEAGVGAPVQAGLRFAEVLSRFKGKSKS